MTKENNFYKDLIKVQNEIQTLYKDESNPYFKSKYVPLPNVLKAVKPILNDNGFLLTQRPLINENGIDLIRTEIIHESGKFIFCEAPLKMEEKDKNNPQKYGSAVTYMRRYSLTALLGLEEDDDDGNIASKLANAADQEMKETFKKKNQEQFKKIKGDLESCGSIEELQATWENNLKGINSLKKYESQLFGFLLETKDKMKELLTEEDE